MSCTRRTAVTLLGLAPLIARPSIAWSRDDGLGFRVPVKADHDDASSALLPLPCEWAAPPEAGKPTVLLIADAQQFYLRPGGAARIAQQLFTSDFNVLSIVGRSRIQGLESLIGNAGQTDWSAAWRLFKSRQWLGDIDAVLRHLDLWRRPERIFLYGRSGGANLIQQAIVRDPGIAHRVFMQAGVNHELDVRLGHEPDRFWVDLVAHDRNLSKDFADFLQENPNERRRAIALLQRMHFFEPADKLASERETLIRLILARNLTELDARAQRYQLDALAEMKRTIDWIRANSHPFEGNLERPEEMNPLLDRLDGARVIGLGELSHGDRESAVTKIAIAKGLISQKGVRLIGIEAPMGSSLVFNRFISGDASFKSTKAESDAKLNAMLAGKSKSEIAQAVAIAVGNLQQDPKARFSNAELVNDAQKDGYEAYRVITVGFDKDAGRQRYSAIFVVFPGKLIHVISANGFGSEAALEALSPGLNQLLASVEFRNTGGRVPSGAQSALPAQFPIPAASSQGSAASGKQGAATGPARKRGGQCRIVQRQMCSGGFGSGMGYFCNTYPQSVCD